MYPWGFYELSEFANIQGQYGEDFEVINKKRGKE